MLDRLTPEHLELVLHGLAPGGLLLDPALGRLDHRVVGIVVLLELDDEPVNRGVDLRKLGLGHFDVGVDPSRSRCFAGGVDFVAEALEALGSEYAFG